MCLTDTQKDPARIQFGASRKKGASLFLDCFRGVTADYHAAGLLGCRVQHELRHSERDSGTCAMAGRVRQGVSTERVLILAGTEEIRGKVSHREDKAEGTLDV